MSSVLYTKEFELGDKVGSHMLSPTSYDAPVKSQCVSCRYIWWRWVICLSCCVQVFHNGIKVVFGNNRSHLTISRVKDINLWIAVALLVSVCEASKPSIIQLCFAEWLDTRVTNWGSLDMKLNDPLSFWKFGFCETWKVSWRICGVAMMLILVLVARSLSLWLTATVAATAMAPTIVTLSSDNG